MSRDRLLIGCAAGFSGDRVDAALPVVETLIARGGPAFLIFETLAERTLALAQLARRQNPDTGYEPQLDAMLRPILQRCLGHGIRIVSNFGAANPRGAARRIRALAHELGVAAPRIAIVTGDGLSAPEYRRLLFEHLGPRGEGLGAADAIVSANAYLGAEPIAAALAAGGVPLYRLAHGRAGDKGNRGSLSVIAYRPQFFELLVEQVTEQAVAALFATRHPSAVRRYLLPKLQAMNFVLDDVLDGGVNDSLNLDTHGKTLSFFLLDLSISVPASLLPLLAGNDADA